MERVSEMFISADSSIYCNLNSGYGGEPKIYDAIEDAVV